MVLCGHNPNFVAVNIGSKGLWHQIAIVNCIIDLFSSHSKLEMKSILASVYDHRMPTGFGCFFFLVSLMLLFLYFNDSKLLVTLAIIRCKKKKKFVSGIVCNKGSIGFGHLFYGINNKIVQ